MSHSDVEVIDGWKYPCLQTRDRSASALEVTWLPFEVKKKEELIALTSVWTRFHIYQWSFWTIIRASRLSVKPVRNEWILCWISILIQRVRFWSTARCAHKCFESHKYFDMQFIHLAFRKSHLWVNMVKCLICLDRKHLLLGVQTRVRKSPNPSWANNTNFHELYVNSDHNHKARSLIYI